MDTMWKFLWISPNFSLYHPAEFQGHEKNKQKKTALLLCPGILFSW